jgi:hypothetical protein
MSKHLIYFHDAALRFFLSRKETLATEFAVKIVVAFTHVRASCPFDCDSFPKSSSSDDLSAFSLLQ